MSTITLDPKPGFVIKSRVLEAQNYLKHSSGTKVFINVCHDNQVPKPPQEFDPAIVSPLIIQNEWEIPIIVSEEKQTTDKKGIPSFVYDCCINLLCFQWCQVNSELRQILNEWCLESVELLYEVTLDREYSIPKMLSKGELSLTIVESLEMSDNGFQKKLQQLKQNDTLGLIEELKPDEPQDDEDLPDLMNINREQKAGKKPLIQEIEEMSIQLEKTSQKPVIKSKSQLSTVTFAVSFQNISDKKYHLLVKLTTDSRADLANQLALSIDTETQQLVLQPTPDSRITLPNISNKLQVPVPASSQSCEPKSFYVKLEQAIYVFV